MLPRVGERAQSRELYGFRKTAPTRCNDREAARGLTEVLDGPSKLGILAISSVE